MRRLDFVFFDAGGGHRAAATALKAVVEQQGRDWDVRIVNLQEVLDAMDVFRRYTGIRMQDGMSAISSAIVRAASSIGQRGATRHTRRRAVPCSMRCRCG